MLQLMFFNQENLQEMKRNYLYLSGILCFPPRHFIFMSRFQHTHTHTHTQSVSLIFAASDIETQ